MASPVEGACELSCEDFDATVAGETWDREITVVVSIVVEIGYSAPGMSYNGCVPEVAGCTAYAPLVEE